MGSCHWSNLWLVLAQYGVESALTALFQRSAVDQKFLRILKLFHATLPFLVLFGIVSALSAFIMSI